MYFDYYKPNKGELVRYGNGSTALMITSNPHAGGFHGRQCMGGITFGHKFEQPTAADRRMWVQCAKWRNQTEEEAALEINWPNEPVDKADSPIQSQPSPLDEEDEATPRLQAEPTPAPDVKPTPAPIDHSDMVAKAIAENLAKISGVGRYHIGDLDKARLDRTKHVTNIYDQERIRQNTFYVGMLVGMPIGASVALLAVAFVRWLLGMPA